VEALLTEALFLLLLGYHSVHVNPAWRHEADEDRRARIHDIAEAVVAACKGEIDLMPGWPLAGCVALEATAAKWESGFRVEIHSGEEKGPAGELCLNQLHRTVSLIPNAKYRVTREEWLATPGLGLESTERCTFAGVKVLAWHVHRCKIRYEGGGWWPAVQIFSEYHHPSQTCGAVALPMSTRRALSYQYLLRGLLYEMKHPRTTP
jgi:hypothetical protein